MVGVRLTYRLSCLALGWLCIVAQPYQECRAGIVFKSPAAITIPQLGVANPYPSPVTVSGIVGRLSNVRVSLFGLSHTYPNDVAAVVVSPSRSSVLLFNGAGSNIAASNLDLVFDDHAPEMLPLNGALHNGTFRPGLEEYDNVFPAPGPGGKLTDADPTPWSFNFASWLKEDPNGEWNLFVLDAQRDDRGTIAGGWALEFDVAVVPEPGFCGFAGLLLPLWWNRRHRRNA